MFKERSFLISLSRWAPYPLIFLPAALAFLYVYSFGVNVVFGDEWAIVTLFQKLYSRTLGITDLWALHGDHRILFPRIALLTLGIITNFNSVAAMYLTLTCFLLTLIGLLSVFKDNVVKASSSLFLFVPVAFMMFSFRQYENMLSGFQVAFGFVQAFSVLALCLLYLSRYDRIRKFAFPAALAGATLGSFSAAQGLFMWPVGLLQLLIGPIERPAKKIMIGVWCSVGLVEWIVYFIGFERAERNSPLSYVLGDPIGVIDYFLTLQGSTLLGQLDIAFFGGLLLVCLAIASLFLVYRYGNLREYSFWISLLLFSLFVLTSIALGRSGNGAEQALQSKYASFAVLTVVATYAILVKLVLERWSYFTTGALSILSLLILISIPLCYLQGIYGAGKRLKAEREKTAFILSTYESQPDEVFQEVHRNPNRVERTRGQTRFLDALNYNVFSDRGRNATGANVENVVTPTPQQEPQEVEQEDGSGDL